MIKMVVFDMAGTTVDENNLVYKTLRKIINAAGFNFSLEQVLAEGAGKEKRAAIKDILALAGSQSDDSLVNRIYDSFVSELAIAYDNFDIKPQPGAEEVFKYLKEKEILVVLNTGYNQDTADSILQKLDWQIGLQIDELITASNVTNNRPYPDMIWLAMKEFRITDSNEVVKVGDSIIDIEEGKNAGCGLSIGITTGAHTYQQLASANPNAIINNLGELLPLL